MALWNDKIQVQNCVDSLTAIEHLTETSDECIQDLDAEACDPCSKHYDLFFDRYDVFTLQSVLGLIQKVGEKE